MNRRELIQALALAGTVPLVHAQAAAPSEPAGPGKVLRLEPGMSLPALLESAGEGDTIEVMPGTYRGQAAVIRQRALTIRGVGAKRPVFEADGAAAEGKALLVVRRAEHVRIENLEFRGVRVADFNGAGIRFEAGRLTVRHCGFFDNEMGILTAHDPEGQLEVHDCEFAQTARGLKNYEWAPPHLLYAGRIRRLTVTGCHFHDGCVGHLIKSRARENLVKYNLLVDGPAGEASYELEFPEGGLAWVVGNVIGQSARTQNSNIVSFGAEKTDATVHGLFMANNTLINERHAGVFVRVSPQRLQEGLDMRFVNNLLVGTGELATGPLAWPNDNRRALLSALQAPSKLDFRLVPGSPLRGSGVAPGQAVGQSLTAAAEFRGPLGTRPLKAPAAWSPGAFQS